MTQTILQILLFDDCSTTYQQMRWSGRVLAEQAKDWRVINLDLRSQECYQWIEQAELVVFYQPCSPRLLPLLKSRRERGLKTAVEYAINFYENPELLPDAGGHQLPHIVPICEMFMQMADTVLVSSTGLYDLLRTKTSTPLHYLKTQYYFIPDSFDCNWPDSANNLTIGWNQGITQISDLIPFIPVLSQFISNNPGVSLRLTGDNEIRSYLKLPAETIYFTPRQGVEESASFWRDCHVALVPLLDSAFNRCYNNAVALESSANATLPLLSDMLPFQEFCAATSLPTFSNPEQLYSLLYKYYADREQLKSDAKRAYQYVLENRIAIAQTERLKLYQSLLPAGLKTHWNWPFGPGYYEVQGVITVESLLLQAKRKAEGLRSKNGNLEAVQFLQELVDSQPFDPDLRLLLLSFAHKDGCKNLRELLNDAKNSFPDDLRFVLFELDCDQLPDPLKWGKLADSLPTLDPFVVEFFTAEIVKSFCQHFSKNRSLSPLAEKLLQFFPNSCQLRLLIAESLLSMGKDASALNHLIWLLEQKKNDKLNHDNLSKIDQKYLQTLITGLKARLSMA